MNINVGNAQKDQQLAVVPLGFYHIVVNTVIMREAAGRGVFLYTKLGHTNKNRN